MPEISFLLNGEAVRLADAPSTRMLLGWLREERGLTGTKESHNEGDCGACTCIAADVAGPRALNTCIFILPQLHARPVRTGERISGQDVKLHDYTIQVPMKPSAVPALACGRHHSDLHATATAEANLLAMQSAGGS